MKLLRPRAKQKPWRLRDYRRMVHLHQANPIPELCEILAAFRSEHYLVYYTLACEQRAMERALDWAINLWGPDWVPGRPKDTDKVQPANEKNTNDAHGGDGASGEVKEEKRECESDASAGMQAPAGDQAGSASAESTGATSPGEQMAQQVGSSPATGAKDGDKQDTSCESTECGSSTPPVSDDTCPGGDGSVASETGSEEGPSKAATILGSEEATSLGSDPEPKPAEDLLHGLIDKLRKEASVSADASERRFLRKKASRIERLRGPMRKKEIDCLAKTDRCYLEVERLLREYQEALDQEKMRLKESTAVQTPTLTRCLQHGDVYASGQTILEQAQRAKGDRAKKILRELEKLVKKECGVFGVSAPKLDKRRFVRELSGKSLRLSRAQQRIFEHKLIVLAVDVSGSCSSYCQELGQAAAALTLKDDRVVVVLHSNGHPVEWVGRVALPFPKPGVQDAIAWWRPLAELSQFLLALGDHDAEWAYQAFSEVPGSQVVWLHNYCASHEVRRMSSHFVPDWPVRMLQGIGSGASVLQALKMLNGRLT